MKKYKTFKQQEVIKLICDGCGLDASVDEGYEFSEFISIEHHCGYGAIHGDGKQVTIDLCQHCFAGMCGDILTVIDPFDNQDNGLAEDRLEYGHVFQAITQSKQVSNALKYNSDIRMSARGILSANRIANQEELQITLKRVEQLWDAQYHSVEGNELHALAELICAYENKSWDSYFSQEPISNDVMSDRAATIANIPCQKSGAASGILADIPRNKDITEDDSTQSSVGEENTD